MVTRDPEHWLWRLDADAWLRAARGELAAGHERVASRRVAVTHARRAAGMALNGVLVVLATSARLPATLCETRWGRSYIDHLRTLSRPGLTDDLRDPMPARACEHARALLAIEVVAGPESLVQLGARDASPSRDALALATRLVVRCATIIAQLRPPTDA